MYWANNYQTHINKSNKLAKHLSRKYAIKGFSGICGVFDGKVLVSATDGVGSKVKIAIEMEKHDTIGIDLVAMVVNDIIAMGAKPIFFQDYIGTNKIKLSIIKDIIKGISRGCNIAGCLFTGGETSELTELYRENDYDLVGFGVGIAEEENLLVNTGIMPRDIVLGLASSGVHANGYSLIRKLCAQHGYDWDDSFGDKTLGEELLTPTRIYANSILSTIGHGLLGVAHITGGGLTDNIPRMLPDDYDLGVELIQGSWEVPEIFTWIQDRSKLNFMEMMRIFNCGIGMALVVSAENVDKITKILEDNGETVYQIGSVINNYKGVTIV